MRPTAADFSIEAGAESTLPKCECCGGVTRIVRAFVSLQGTARVVLLVRWTVGAQHDAEVAVSVGSWCDADRSPRRLVALLLRQQPNGPAFMVVDADLARWDGSSLLGTALRSEDVLNTPLASEVFAILDAAGAADLRLANWHLS